VWQRNILTDFGGRRSRADQRVAARRRQQRHRHPGGLHAGIVALDKMSGKTVWASQQLSDEAGYSSPLAADVQGAHITLTSQAGVGVRAWTAS
jgi:hypothetical protein